MADSGLVNGRDPRSGRDLVFHCYPLELHVLHKKETDLLGQPLDWYAQHGHVLTGESP